MYVNEHEKLFNITLQNSDCIAIQHLTVAVGYSIKSKICTRIRKRKKDKKTQLPKEKDKKTNNDQQNIRISKLLNQWFLLVRVEVFIFNVR